MDLSTALTLAHDLRGSHETKYREALEFLIDHRSELKSRLFVLLPGGLTSNTDPTWDKVRQNTDSRCGCGNERVLLPINVRETFEAGEPMTLGYKDKIHVRPKGSDKESCVVRLEVVCFQDTAEQADAPKAEAVPQAPVEAPASEAEAPAPAEPPAPRTYGMRLMKDPFGPVSVNAFVDLLAPSAYRLDAMAENMPEGGLRLMFVDGTQKLPVLNITAVDPAKPEITITLDADMEVFDPSLEPDRHFVEMAAVSFGGTTPSASETPEGDAPATPEEAGGPPQAS